MPKDYAKRQSRPKKYSRKKSNSHRKLWVITLLLIILFIYVLFQLGYNKKHRRYTSTIVKTIPIQQDKAQIKQTAKNIRFDFYTILKNEKVTVQNQQPSGPQYYLQIASLKQYAAADRLKAELALLGFDASVDQIIISNTTWNRVRIGPYYSEKSAHADQQRLDASKIISILRKE